MPDTTTRANTVLQKMSIVYAQEFKHDLFHDYMCIYLSRKLGSKPVENQEQFRWLACLLHLLANNTASTCEEMA